MNETLFVIGQTPVTREQALLGGAAGLVVILLVLFVVLWAGARRRRKLEQKNAERGVELERHLADLMRMQSEMTGRMQTMSEIFGTRTSDLARLVADKIDSTNLHVNRALNEQREKTDVSLSKLNERLAVIDRAQTTITSLTSEVVSLQSILSDKQQRGAFGQGRMEAIVSDGLATGTYDFQATLSNNSRPDALIHMPNGAPSLVVDAKFPLESWQRLNDATSPEAVKTAKAELRNNVGVHVKAIADKYLIPGETQDTAFMFVPSESIFADLHERFEDVVQKAVRTRVVIVSPSLLLLSIQVIQALLRDVRMREQAHLIQTEVRHLMDDVGRLRDRVEKLQTHFGQANKDLDMIGTSAGKIVRRGERIEALELDDAPLPEPPPLPEEEG